MIKVNRDANDEPDCLKPGETRGANEATRAIEAFNNNESFDYKVYRDPEVKVALAKVFGRKCAFCESLIEGTQPGDVEHYRPKGKVIVEGLEGGEPTEKDGYYWLGSTWSNLLMSCADCNRPRYQKDADGVERLIGKANFFPLEDEDARVTVPGNLDQERPLLLDPCSHDPNEHLEFTNEGGIQPVVTDGIYSEKGKATIYVCGLGRIELFNMRARHRRTVMQSIRHINAALAEGRDPSLDVEDLVFLLDKHSAYTAYTRQLVRRHLVPFIQSIDPLPVDLRDLLAHFVDA
jgi:hypothetical protein